MYRVLNESSVSSSPHDGSFLVVVSLSLLAAVYEDEDDYEDGDDGSDCHQDYQNDVILNCD